jgi:hypothetical protein
LPDLGEIPLKTNKKPAKNQTSGITVFKAIVFIEFPHIVLRKSIAGLY